jgi:hypothetical protein
MSFGQRNIDREKPEIDFPEGPVPTELVITDLIEGDGPEAKAGDTVSTHYVGVAWSTGEEFDASWSHWPQRGPDLRRGPRGRPLTHHFLLHPWPLTGTGAQLKAR